MVILWVTTARSMSPSSVSRRPLMGTIFAQSFLGEYSNDYGGLMAFAVAGSLPIVLLFIFFQKYLVSGMTAGAVKG